MDKFINIVNVKIKNKSKKDYIKKIKNITNFDGLVSSKHVAIDSSTYCMIEERNSKEDLMKARKTIEIFDKIIPLIKEESSEIDITGSVSETAGFYVSASHKRVQGFSFAGGFIPPSSTLQKLFTISYWGYDGYICLPRQNACWNNELGPSTGHDDNYDPIYCPDNLYVGTAEEIQDYDASDNAPTIGRWCLPDDNDCLDANEISVNVTTGGCACGSDVDNDGVANSFDKDNETPEGVKVYGDGTSIDSDRDGVADDMDKEPFTPNGSEVD